MAGLLEGLRVIEVATFVFAPAAGTVLSDFGAEVIHVEPPGIGDPYRMLTRMRPLPECEENYCWLLDSRNKKSVVLDLKREEGHAVLLDLIRGADIFITNYHPSVLEELKLSYATLAAENDRLIYAHGTGYGENGSEVEKPGYDATAWWARSGLMDAVRPGGGELALATAGMGDHPSSISIVAGISLALYARERTGRGTKVSSSLTANGAWANSILIQAALCGGKSYVPPTQVGTSNALLNHYRAADGRSFFLVIIKEADEFEQFCNAIERPDLITDPRFEKLEDRRANASDLVRILSDWFAARPLAQWQRIFEEHAITFGSIATCDEAAADRQMECNGVFVDMEGRPGTRVIDSPITLSDFPKCTPRPPPELGEHSVGVLRELGYDQSRIAALLESGVIGEG
ncbi:MAG: CaiB/BaiF CoA-transferase family protein [Gammaproteobacteria bacterium]|nr:CaiB/BaiF CoA-transferase family protein [Gammaproteobacteria bacterium]